MIYEERVYTAMPGKMAELKKRFDETAMRMFKKHGIHVVGFWETVIGPNNNELVYILGFKSLAERERCWHAFVEDKEWQKAKAESEKNGPLVASIANRILRPTDFSPLK